VLSREQVMGGGGRQAQVRQVEMTPRYRYRRERRVLTVGKGGGQRRGRLLMLVHGLDGSRGRGLLQLLQTRELAQLTGLELERQGRRPRQKKRRLSIHLFVQLSIILYIFRYLYHRLSLSFSHL